MLFWFWGCQWCKFFQWLGEFWSAKHLLGCGCCWANWKRFVHFLIVVLLKENLCSLFTGLMGSPGPQGPPGECCIPLLWHLETRENKSRVTASHSFSSSVMHNDEWDGLNPPSHFSAGPPGLQGFRGEAGLPGAKGKLLFPSAITAALADVLF